MRNFFRRIGNAVARFMYGRYGTDELNMFFLILAIVCLLLSYVPTVGFVFGILAIVLLAWSNFRVFSKNIPKRRRELDTYLRIKRKPKNARILRKNKKRDKKTHCYFKCPSCKAVLRVPKGKGEIIVTCPKCNTKTPKKT